MWPLRVTLHLLLALTVVGGEVEGEHKLTWPDKQQQRAAAGAKEIQAGIAKELKRVGRSSREMQPFDRPTTLQRMIEEATHFRQDGRLSIIAMIAGHLYEESVVNMTIVIFISRLGDLGRVGGILLRE